MITREDHSVWNEALGLTGILLRLSQLRAHAACQKQVTDTGLCLFQAL